MEWTWKATMMLLFGLCNVKMGECAFTNDTFQKNLMNILQKRYAEGSRFSADILRGMCSSFLKKVNLFGSKLIGIALF